jgi:hypothetical protein
VERISTKIKKAIYGVLYGFFILVEIIREGTAGMALRTYPDNNLEMRSKGLLVRFVKRSVNPRRLILKII